MGAQDLIIEMWEERIGRDRQRTACFIMPLGRWGVTVVERIRPHSQGAGVRGGASPLWRCPWPPWP